MATYGVKLINTQTGTKTVLKKGVTKSEARQFTTDMNEYFKLNGLDNLMNVHVFIEMNAHEKVVDRLIQDAVSEFIGGKENVLLDYAEDSTEYKIAKAGLNHDTLFEEIYSEVMMNSRKNYASHIRFAGKSFIEERIETRLKKEGYGKEVQ